MVTAVTADRPKKIEDTESNPKIQNLLIYLIGVGLPCMVTAVTADRPQIIDNTENNPKTLCDSEFTSKCIQWHFTTLLRPFPCLNENVYMYKRNSCTLFSWGGRGYQRWKSQR
jgi:hypothetical protein